MVKNKKTPLSVKLGHFCLQATMIILPNAIAWDFYGDSNIWIKLLFFSILSVGGIMLYIPIAIKLEEIRKKYGK